VINKISKILSKYKTQRYKLDNSTTFFIYLKAILASIFITFLIVLIPALLIYNLFILEYLHNILKVIIVILMPLLAFSFNYFFIEVIKNYESKLKEVSFKHMFLIESVIFSFFLVMITTIVVSII